MREDLEYSEIIKHEDGIKLSLAVLILIIFLFICSAFLYSTKYKLDIVTDAYGAVIPSTKVKSVQHLEGGIIKEIKVETGQLVNNGDILLVLEPTESKANIAELDQRLANLMGDIIRLEAEATGKKPKYSEQLNKDFPQIVKNSQKLYNGRLAALNAVIKEYKNQIKNDKQTLILLEEQISISEDLLADQLTNKLTHLNLLKEKSTLTAAIENAELLIKKVRNSSRAEARTLLEERRAEYEELSERRVRFQDNLDRRTVRAPVDGIIKQRYINTVGGVIKAGETLVDIVPADDKLIIESKLPVEDIGYIQIGQEALVHLSGPSLSRYKPVIGEVIGVSPDAIIPEEPNTAAYYEIKIQTDQTYFSKGIEKYEMFPGTQVVAGIIVGRRTLYEYITEPIFGNLSNALSEQ